MNKEIAERIVNSHLDVSPREYVTTRLALIDAITSALDEAVSQERERCARTVAQLKCDEQFSGHWHNGFAVAQFLAIEAIEDVRKESQQDSGK